jgi:L-asparaginase
MANQERTLMTNGGADKRPRILLLGHGGTIGMLIRQLLGREVCDVPVSDKEFRAAVELVLAPLSDRVKITFEFMTSKDSINITHDDWGRLCERIRVAQDIEHYDAVAVTHGTDSKGHTAAALALALNGIDALLKWQRIPVVLSGAQNSIHHFGGDGRFNLENLLLTAIAAIEADVADVLVNFWDRVLLGPRAMKVSERRMDAFDSPAYPHVGRIDANGVHLDTRLLPASKPQFKTGLERATIAADWGKGVVVLKLYPGFDPEFIRILLDSGKVRALVLESLGEGNVCNEGEGNLLPMIEHATISGIPVFISSQFPGGSANPTHYEAGRAAIKAGAIPCFDHTAPAIDVKVRWLLANGVTEISALATAMRTNFAGEVTES